MKYKAETDTMVKRETIFESCKMKAYSLIWERCTLSMQGRIKQKKNGHI